MLRLLPKLLGRLNCRDLLFPEERKLLEPLFDQLDGFISPLIGGIDKVKDAADSVGVDF